MAQCMAHSARPRNDVPDGSRSIGSSAPSKCIWSLRIFVKNRQYSRNRQLPVFQNMSDFNAQPLLQQRKDWSLRQCMAHWTSARNVTTFTCIKINYFRWQIITFYQDYAWNIVEKIWNDVFTLSWLYSSYLLSWNEQEENKINV
jgi:hypothetical protein